MQDTSGSAFPYHHILRDRDGDVMEINSETGITRRELFALYAPEPSEGWVKMQGESDRLKNPHGDTYKPLRRSVEEIKADWRYQWADEMIAAGARERR